MSEEWREVPGFNGYDVSSLGAVRSWRRQGGAGRSAEPRIKAQWECPDGYKHVSLMRDGKQVRQCVSWLVLAAFAGPRPGGHEARHLDGNPANNNANNLLWSTHTENIRDKYKHGTMPSGDAHWSRRMPERRSRGVRASSKLDDEKVRQIRARREAGETLCSLAGEFGVDHTLISRIAKRKAWAHVS